MGSALERIMGMIDAIDSGNYNVDPQKALDNLKKSSEEFDRLTSEYQQKEEYLRQPETKYKYARDSILNFLYKDKSSIKGKNIINILDKYMDYADSISLWAIERDIKARDKIIKYKSIFDIDENDLEKYLEDYEYHDDVFKSSNADHVKKYLNYVKEKINPNKKYTKTELKEKFDYFFKENDEFYIKKYEENEKERRKRIKPELDRISKIGRKEGRKGLAKYTIGEINKLDDKMDKAL